MRNKTELCGSTVTVVVYNEGNRIMRSTSQRLRIACVAIGVILAACGSTPSASSGSSGGSAATAAPSVLVASSAPSATPSPDLTTAWASPESGATVDVDTVRVSALIGGGVAPAKVAFWAASGGHRATICSASKADGDGFWSCKADLRKSGMRPGAITFGFNVTTAAGVDKDPAGTRKLTWAVAPSPPTGVHYKLVPGQSRVTVKVSWDAASVAGADAVEVYGLMECLAPPKSTGKPCIVRGTSLESATLERFARVKPKAGSTSWTEVPYEITTALGNHADSGDLGTYSEYYALLVVAVNKYGKSRFIIAKTTVSCYDCILY
jgi:hypothetical protein